MLEKLAPRKARTSESDTPPLQMTPEQTPKLERAMPPLPKLTVQEDAASSRQSLGVFAAPEPESEQEPEPNPEQEPEPSPEPEPEPKKKQKKLYKAKPLPAADGVMPSVIHDATEQGEIDGEVIHEQPQRGTITEAAKRKKAMAAAVSAAVATNDQGKEAAIDDPASEITMLKSDTAVIRGVSSQTRPARSFRAKAPNPNAAFGPPVMQRQITRLGKAQKSKKNSNNLPDVNPVIKTAQCLPFATGDLSTAQF